MPFYSSERIEIPSVTAEEMGEVDRIAVDEFHLGLLQMMENAGRNLADLVLRKIEGIDGSVVILAGSGGNGGGGLAAARHLHNHGIKVKLCLSKPLLDQAASKQLGILHKAGIQPLQDDEVETALRKANLVVDALIGYSLQGTPHGRIAELIELCNQYAKQVVSLDVPSGMDSTSGETPGVAVHSHLTLTLALPKTGLEQVKGDLYLADIGIPPEVYEPLGIHFKPFFQGNSWIPIGTK